MNNIPFGKMNHLGGTGNVTSISFTLQNTSFDNNNTVIGTACGFDTFGSVTAYPRTTNGSVIIYNTFGSTALVHNFRITNCRFSQSKRNISMTYSATVSVYGIKLSDIGIKHEAISFAS